MSSRFLKILGGLAAVVVLAAAAAPLATGRIAESELRAIVDEVSAARGPEVEWRITGVDRGAYASTARSVVTLHDDDGEARTVRLRHEIAHGPGITRPYLARIVTTVDPAEQFPAELREAFAPREPIEGVLRVSLLGEARLTVESPPLPEAYSLADGGTAEWQGLSLEIAWDRGRDRATFAGSVPRLRIDSPGNRLLIRDVRLDGEARRAAGAIWSGRSTLEIGRLRSASGDGRGAPPLTLEGVTVRSETGHDERDGVSQRARVRIARVEVADTSLRSVDADVRVERLHPSLVEASEAHPVGSEAWLDAIDFAEVVALTPRVAIDPLSVATQEGTIDGRITAELARGSLPDAQVTPGRWMEMLDARARLVVPEAVGRLIAASFIEYRVARLGGGDGSPGEAVVDRLAGEQLEALVDQGLLVRRDGAYEIEARFADGAVTVNGERMF